MRECEAASPRAHGAGDPPTECRGGEAADPPGDSEMPWPSREPSGPGGARGVEPGRRVRASHRRAGQSLEDCHAPQSVKDAIEVTWAATLRAGDQAVSLAGGG